MREDNLRKKFGDLGQNETHIKESIAQLKVMHENRDAIWQRYQRVVPWYPICVVFYSRLIEDEAKGPYILDTSDVDKPLCSLPPMAPTQQISLICSRGVDRMLSDELEAVKIANKQTESVLGQKLLRTFRLVLAANKDSVFRVSRIITSECWSLRRGILV